MGQKPQDGQEIRPQLEASQHVNDRVDNEFGARPQLVGQRGALWSGLFLRHVYP